MPTANAGVVDNGMPQGVKEFLFARENTQQTTNIAANDHIKFDTVVDSRSPSNSVSLDTTTAFSNVAGAASIGRFTLKAGRRYHLRGTVNYVLASGATGLLEVAWYDATNSAELQGSRAVALVATTATHDIGSGIAEAFVTPATDILVELRIITATVVTQIGTTGARQATALIESDV